MLVLKITPLRAISAEADFELRLEAGLAPGTLGYSVDIDMAEAKRELIKARFDVPRWLEWLDTVIQ